MGRDQRRGEARLRHDVPSDGNWSKEFATPRRYLAIHIKPKQGELLGDGSSVKHFAIVTNRNDPEAGSGLDLIRWHHAGGMSST